MKTSVITIKYVILLSVVFLLLAYTISLNEENKYLILNTPWLSNDFVFAIAGGALASLLVILVCELQKYFLLKRQTEDAIYIQLFGLYEQITIIYYNTRRQLSEKVLPVPSNLIDGIANSGQLFLSNLSSVDYTTLGKHKVIIETLNQYKGKKGEEIRSFLQDCIFLPMAIKEDRIEILKQGVDKLSNSSSPKTNLTLKKINKNSAVILSFIEKSLYSIDKECSNRYHWNELKRNIIISEENFASADLETYLEHPIINFE